MEEKQTIKKCSRCGYSAGGKSRSNSQNSYYWGVVIKELSEHTGFTPDEMHEVLKHRFLGYFKTTREGRELWTCKSTTALSSGDMEEYLSNIRTYASINLDCYIPSPHEERNEKTNENWFDTKT